MKKDQICCPHCGRETNTYIYDRRLSQLLYGIYFIRTTRNPISGCRVCIGEQYGTSLLPNVLYSNLMWPVYFVGSLFGYLCHLIPGHSPSIVQLLKNHSKNEDSKALLIPGIIPSDSISRKRLERRALALAKTKKSLLWTSKAWCYKNQNHFFTNIKGNILSSENSSIVIEDDKLYYRDFFSLPQENRNIEKELFEFLKQWENELEFIFIEYGGSIIIHAKSLYEIDYDDEPTCQLEWIISQIGNYRTKCIRWFNSAKLK